MQYQHIHFQYFDDNFGGDPQFVQEILSIFLKDVPARMHQLKRQIDARQWQEVAQIAHSIKASVKMLGIEDFLSIVESIESRALMPDDALEIGLLYSHAEHIMVQANLEIEDFLSKSQS